ncbi:hypothetical protein QE152_g17014 [Popillia japonica]|uniref:Uncharacterized protein n=1 Tax=Popillia japonica TaxID=7064 RepID=A0AAW1L5T4_POPJA
MSNASAWLGRRWEKSRPLEVDAGRYKAAPLSSLHLFFLCLEILCHPTPAGVLLIDYFDVKVRCTDANIDCYLNALMEAIRLLDLLRKSYYRAISWSDDGKADWLRVRRSALEINFLLEGIFQCNNDYFKSIALLRYK